MRTGKNIRRRMPQQAAATTCISRALGCCFCLLTPTRRCVVQSVHGTLVAHWQPLSVCVDGQQNRGVPKLSVRRFGLISAYCVLAASVRGMLRCLL